MELQRAIADRNRLVVAHRLAQAIRGLVGREGFRFYLSGTSREPIERAGHTIEAVEVERWKGLVTVERVWARRTEERSGDPTRPGDYPSIPAELDAVRAPARRYLEQWQSGAGIESAPEPSTNPLAPLLLLLPMAEALNLRFEDPFSALRLRLVASKPADWDRIDELNGLMLARLDGLQTGIHS